MGTVRVSNVDFKEFYFDLVKKIFQISEFFKHAENKMETIGWPPSMFDILHFFVIHN